MRTPFGLEEIDGTTLGRIEDVLHLREAADPDPRRAEVIRSIRAIREMFAGSADEKTSGNALVGEGLARVLEELAFLERTSLGTSDARRVRSAATPRGIAEILDRHEKSRNTWEEGRGSDYGGAGPVVLRMLLGKHLRRLREHVGIMRTEAAAEIRASESKMSRIEFGRTTIRQCDLLGLLRLYGVGPEESDQLIALAQKANGPSWWRNFTDVIPAWFEPYLGLESAAALIRLYEARYVPELLQTPAYSNEILASSHFWAGKREESLLIREERKRRFERGQARLWAVIDESALYREVGGRNVLLSQLHYLLDAIEAPNVCLQIAPLSRPCEAGCSFSILRFREPDLPDTVYLENMASAIYLDKNADVGYYQAALNELTLVSSDPDDTPGIIAGVIGRIERGMPTPANLPRA